MFPIDEFVPTAEQLKTFPIGMEFNPTGEQLIEAYLLPWAKGEKLGWNGIVEKQMYGENFPCEPWKVFSDIESAYHSKTEEEEEKLGEIKYNICAFTTLLRDSNSKKVSRSSGNGIWVEETGPEKIINYDIGCIIGHSRMLAYEHSGEAADIGQWTMQEYSLSDESVKKSGRSNAADLVVCKITKTVKKKKLIDYTPFDEDEGDEEFDEDEEDEEGKGARVDEDEEGKGKEGKGAPVDEEREREKREREPQLMKMKREREREPDEDVRITMKSSS